MRSGTLLPTGLPLLPSYCQLPVALAVNLLLGYVEHYNNIRLNSAIGYLTPKDMLAGRSRLPTRFV